MILHLTRPEKALLVSALCTTHKHLQPTMNTPITLRMANETLSYPGLIDLLKLVSDRDTLIGLLTLIEHKNNKESKRVSTPSPA